MSHKIANELEAILDRERTALISGDLAALANLSEQKDVLEQEFKKRRLPADKLAMLAKKGESNARLFKSALTGLKSAQNRLKDISDVRSGLSHYTQQGARQHESTTATSLERKA